MISKLKLSTVAIACVLITCLLIDVALKNWKKQDRVIEWDVHWYYGYLPALFIYHDIKLEKSDYKFDNNYYLIWTVPAPNGKNIIKSTCGLAIMYAPFFFVADAFASLTNYAENGFSEPYKIFLLLGALFYLYIGLDYLRKILRHYNFSDQHIAITIFLIGLGTNLLCYASQSATMSHVFNFCLFSVFIYRTIKWYEHPSVISTIAIGLLLGLISLIRPSNIIIIIFFLLYGISIFTELKQRMSFMMKKWFLLVVIFLLVPLVWIPQFIYWKITTGHFFFDSYVGEPFFFKDPKILEGLFSFRKGWLIYTPMMLFSLIGLFYTKGFLKKLRLPIILFFLVNIYVIFSWWCWWYGGCFGQRSMIDSYAMLAIPFASFVQHIAEKKWSYKIPLVCLSLFFIWLNVFQTFQFEYKVLHWDGMTKELYFKIFGKMHRVKNYDRWVNSPDQDVAKMGKRSDRELSSSLLPGTNNSSSKKIVSEKIVHLKAANNKYVCADEAMGDIVIANRAVAGNWETFKLVLFSNNSYAIRSFKKFYLAAEIDRQSQITATRPEAKTWESFTIVSLDADSIALRAVNGKYLSIDEIHFDGELFAKGDSIGRKEKFKLEVVEHN